MKPFKIFSILICLTIVTLVYHQLVSAEIRNRVVAIVNNEVITLYELNTKTRELTGSDPADLELKDKKKYLETRRKILDLLIEEKIANEKTQELGIKLTPKEVDVAIEKIKKDNHLTHEDLIANLKKQGMSYESYREIIKNDLERMQLINLEVKSKIIIREEKIREFYDEHKDQFSSQEKVHLAGIFLGQKDPSNQRETRSLHEKAQTIFNRLKTGEDFGELAKEMSQGPGAKEGGDLGFFKTTELDPRLQEAIKELPEDSISEPIITPSGIQIIKLLERQKGRTKPLEEVKNAIYGILYQEEVNKRYSSWIKKLREKAYTKIIF
jgi:peptidyl-prolyl cis-trans isomerase SurA